MVSFSGRAGDACDLVIAAWFTKVGGIGGTLLAGDGGGIGGTFVAGRGRNDRLTNT